MHKVFLALVFILACLSLSSCFSISIDPAKNANSKNAEKTKEASSSVTTTTTMEILTRQPDPDGVDFKKKRDEIDSSPWEADNTPIQITGYLSYKNGVAYLTAAPDSMGNNFAWEIGSTFKLNKFKEKDKLFSGHKITVSGKVSVELSDNGDHILKTISCDKVALVN